MIRQTISRSVLLCLICIIYFAPQVKATGSGTDTAPSVGIPAPKGERTTISNSTIALALLHTEEGLSIESIKEVKTGLTYTFPQSSLLSLGEATDKITNLTVQRSADSIFTVEITYPTIIVKQVYRLYQDIPVIGCDFYIKGRDSRAVEFNTKETKLLDIAMDSHHWASESISFYDQTDECNTLVTKERSVGYHNNDYSSGNILKFTNLETSNGLFFVKEAPTAVAQLYYSGYDFITTMNSASVVGAGVAAKDISSDRWTRAYGVTIGFTGKNKITWLARLRRYQKRSRNYSPESDDMIMMNTWGDRNKDGRINEQFILKELKEASKLGVTHYQIDDGWQQALSKNSSNPNGRAWDLWSREDWEPHRERFPNGLDPVIAEAKRQKIELGLWFHPSNHDNYSNWETDAKIVIDLYNRYKIRYFKIDGVQMPEKAAEVNLRSFYDKVKRETNNEVYFNLDVTADIRGGYHFMYEYGNIFLENRYTDRRSYYPCWTLRNLWMLSSYVPPEKIQIEFLNRWRRDELYGDDPFAPMASPFEYQFAITMMAQPLAWFEASGLPEGEIEKLSPIIERYKKFSSHIHKGVILPIGDEPTGASWTGFQSIAEGGAHGFILIFREQNSIEERTITTHLQEGTRVTLKPILGANSADKKSKQRVGADGTITIKLKDPHSYTLYFYESNIIY